MHTNNSLCREIELFVEFITIERGLATNTIAAYRHDIEKSADFLSSVLKRNSWRDVTTDDLLDVLDDMRDQEFETSSIARRLVAIKVFFKFLYSESLVPVNISEVMDSPRLWKILPDFLSVSEIDRLMSVFKTRTDDPLEFRNRVILELLYSSGLRVSEAATLPIRSIDFEEELIRVTGKGS
ncbi:MAG: site-specific integrase, partial [Lentisphaeria bacterium]|nr:site-specific integrase [Lentisphaeria bacterium]